MNPFGKEHSDILFYFFNAAVIVASSFFFLWIKDRMGYLKDGQHRTDENLAGLKKSVAEVLAMCSMRGRDCPLYFRSKSDALKDWEKLDKRLDDIKFQIELMRKELKEHSDKRDDELWQAVNNHGHTPDGKVIR